MVSKLKKQEKSKHATYLRGVCLIHDTVCTPKCKLVQDFLETETLVQLQTWVPMTFSSLLYWKQSLETSILAPHNSWQCHCSVSTKCAQKVYLSAFRAWIEKLKTESLSRENTFTGLNEWIWIHPRMRLQSMSATIKWTPLVHVYDVAAQFKIVHFHILGTKILCQS